MWDDLTEKINKISEQTIELLMLSATLDPKNTYTLFNVEDICKLVDKFYPKIFLTKKKFS
jgi:hypothetical protein